MYTTENNNEKFLDRGEREKQMSVECMNGVPKVTPERILLHNKYKYLFKNKYIIRKERIPSKSRNFYFIIIFIVCI